MRRVGKVSSIDKFERGFSAQRKPIAPIVPMWHAQEVFARSLAPFDKSDHWLPAPLDDLGIAVGLVNGPGADHTRIAPGRAKVPSVLKGKRCIAGKSSAGPLRLH